MAEPCAECGFDEDTPILDSLRVIGRLPETVAALLQPLGEKAYQRPVPTVWSANEYIWHLADNFRFSAEWMHDVRVLDHPTHFAVDFDRLIEVREYGHLSPTTGLWALEQSCRLFVEEAAMTDPDRTFYYRDWQDCTARQIVGFLAHEAVHHAFDIRRIAGKREAAHAG